MSGLRKLFWGVLGIFVLNASADANQSAELKNDLTEAFNWIKQTHPQLSYSTNESQLDSLVKKLTSTKFTNSADAWRQLALFNPVLNDGHLGILYPEKDYETHLQSGGSKFSLNVEFNENGELVLANSYRDLPSGAKIININGKDTSVIVKELMRRMRGESMTLRKELIKRRFPAYLWSMYGSTNEYEVTFQNEETSVTYLLEKNAESATVHSPNNFSFEMVGQDTAYLDIRSFDINLKEEFSRFLEQAFTQINSTNANKLVIDLRNNGGGAHDLSDQLLNYITDKKVTPISRVIARVVPANQKLLQGAELNSVVDTPYARWYVPEAKNPLRFDGEVYVLIGKFTYSQAIVFATQVQDFGLGKLVGETTGGRGNQTAQVQRMTLPNSGLEVVAPIYIMIRASGDDSSHFVQPDIHIADSSGLASKDIIGALESD